jgi:hypothetical protein
MLLFNFIHLQALICSSVEPTYRRLANDPLNTSSFVGNGKTIPVLEPPPALYPAGNIGQFQAKYRRPAEDRSQAGEPSRAAQSPGTYQIAEV